MDNFLQICSCYVLISYIPSRTRIMAPMLVSSQTRMFRLKAGSVSCDREGLFVGSASLLAAEKSVDGAKVWAVRDEQELNDDLSACYGLPIDCAAKRSGLACVATALSRGDVALAAIATLLLQFPDPPIIEKDIGSPEDELALAVDLFRSGLLKSGYWDPSKHPRTEEPPNRGWFAPADSEGSAVPEKRPPRRAVKTIKDFGRGAAKKGSLARLRARGGRWALLLEVLESLAPTELNTGEPNQETADWKASFDPSKTLKELQEGPTENELGYELHHIVEQNPFNLDKKEVEKFTREKLEDPSNLVWIPRLQHERITAYYNSKDEQGRLNRDVIKMLPFDQQRAIGLEQLRAVGVLR
jgi:hypothetical protein